MKLIADKNYPQERALYALRKTVLKNCTFSGEEDGESALKEAANITAEGCTFKLRYPLWHNKNLKLNGCELTSTCRAALWYTRNAVITGSRLNGIKAVRECNGVNISNCSIVSPEFGWKSKNITMANTALQSEYAFLLSQGIALKGVTFNGKYSFQYTKDVRIDNCVLNTKDAFWHAKNVTVTNSVVSGEYLGWYSKNLTFINCKITGTQPLCYCKNLKLVNCKMLGTDLSFEYSQVKADIKGEIVSVKNPRSGCIRAGGIGKVIITKDSRYKCRCKIITP